MDAFTLIRAYRSALFFCYWCFYIGLLQFYNTDKGFISQAFEILSTIPILLYLLSLVKLYFNNESSFRMDANFGTTHELTMNMSVKKTAFLTISLFLLKFLAFSPTKKFTIASCKKCTIRNLIRFVAILIFFYKEI